VPADAVLF